MPITTVQLSQEELKKLIGQAYGVDEHSVSISMTVAGNDPRETSYVTVTVQLPSSPKPWDNKPSEDLVRGTGAFSSRAGDVHRYGE